MNSAGRMLLALRQATFRLDDRPVFPHTDWSLRRGEHWAVTGPTGAGKTVFCRAVCNELPVIHGTLDYRFRPLSGREPEARIEYLAAEHWTFDPTAGAPARWFSLDEEQSPRVADVLAWDAVEKINPFEVVRRRRADIVHWERRAQQIIRWLGIAPLLAKPLLALSNGERRKVALARALMRTPRILILDDPFAGLDCQYRRHLRDLLATLIRRRATTLLLVGADSADWPSGLTHLLHIERFRIVGQGPLRRLRRDPRMARLLRDCTSAPAGARPLRPRARRRETPGPELVRLQDVQVQWGRSRILEHVNWTVRAGESWAIVGPNGSGKSTLLSFILGDNPQVFANDVRIFGRPRGSGESVWDIKRHIGWVSPEFHAGFDPALSGLATVLTGFYDAATLCVAPPARRRAAAKLWLRKLRLAPLAGHPFGQLSAGEQRLLLLARALVKAPRLLILDEPCQGLDRAHRTAFIAEVDRRIRQGVTVLYVTHQRGEIPPSIRRILRLGGGCARAGSR